MTPTQSLALIGWSPRQFAERIGRPYGTVRRWIDGTAGMPIEVAAWLDTAARFHHAHQRRVPLAQIHRLLEHACDAVDASGEG